MIFIDNDESTSAIDNIPFTSTTGDNIPFTRTTVTPITDSSTTGPTTSEITNRPKIGGSYGWICPVCGRGNAPWNSCCPCKNSNIEITY